MQMLMQIISLKQQLFDFFSSSEPSLIYFMFFPTITKVKVRWDSFLLFVRVSYCIVLWNNNLQTTNSFIKRPLSVSPYFSGTFFWPDQVTRHYSILLLALSRIWYNRRNTLTLNTHLAGSLLIYLEQITLKSFAANEHTHPCS